MEYLKMKKTFLLSLITFAIFACNEQDKKAVDTTGNSTAAAADTANYTEIKWLDSVKNIGTLNLGQNAQVKFRFQNVGSKPLFIVNAEPGCGCTVADYPKNAIAPGKEGEIVAGFDTKNQHAGEFRKNISVTTNTKYATGHTIIFTGVIKGEGETDQAVPLAVPADSASAATSKRKVARKVLNTQKFKQQ
jgi:hypothetical protein